MRRASRSKQQQGLVLLMVLVLFPGQTCSFSPLMGRSPIPFVASHDNREGVLVVQARRRNNKNNNDDNTEEDNMSDWYEPVDPQATPENVFLKEMERQMAANQNDKDGPSASTVNPSMNPYASSSSSAMDGKSSYMAKRMASNNNNKNSNAPLAQNAKLQEVYRNTLASSDRINPNYYGDDDDDLDDDLEDDLYSTGSGGANEPAPQGYKRKWPTNEQLQAAEATLQEYQLYQVSDNYLGRELVNYFRSQGKIFGLSKEEEEAWENMSEVEHEEELNRQIAEWKAQDEAEGKDFDDDDDVGFDQQFEANEDDEDDDDPGSWARMPPEEEQEPWDHWGDEVDDAEMQQERVNEYAAQIFNQDMRLDLDKEDTEEDLELDRMEEEAFVARLSQIKTRSKRLERARRSPKSKDYFARPPDAFQGYDKMWVSAVDNVCFGGVKGNLENYGIQFADNFGDWEDGCAEDGLFTIEEMASFKARSVYNVTGLPCIASRTSFEIEPVPPDDIWERAGVPMVAPPPMSSSGKPLPKPPLSPRICSGYRINDIAMNVDYLVEALLPVSEPNRVTRFHSCMCFYNGDMEIYTYGVCDVDLYFCNSLRTFIPMSLATNDMLKTLVMTFNMKYQEFLQAKVDEVAGTSGGASLMLRDRVLKDGKVLPNDIIDVSSFMETQIDVNLMDDCAKELSRRFEDKRPTKILTVATTGLVIALPMAKYLQVPVVYARKERTVVMADAYRASYSSKTIGQSRELLVSKSHLHAEDRILIIDDFLSSGSSQEALLRIVSDSGATCIGVGVLLEKVYESGRQALAGFNVPIHSLCRVASVREGVIRLLEEEGMDRDPRFRNDQSLMEEAQEKMAEATQADGSIKPTRKSF